MKRPSKKEIKAAIEKLKEKPGEVPIRPERKVGKPSPSKSNQRARKKGV